MSNIIKYSVKYVYLLHKLIKPNLDHFIYLIIESLLSLQWENEKSEQNINNIFREYFD